MSQNAKNQAPQINRVALGANSPKARTADADNLQVIYLATYNLHHSPTTDLVIASLTALQRQSVCSSLADPIVLENGAQFWHAPAPTVSLYVLGLEASWATEMERPCMQQAQLQGMMGEGTEMGVRREDEN